MLGAGCRRVLRLLGVQADLRRGFLDRLHGARACDTAAREIIALADPEMAAYNDTQACLIPGNNYRKMCRFLGNSWGYGALGNDSWLEKLLS